MHAFIKTAVASKYHKVPHHSIIREKQFFAGPHKLDSGLDEGLGLCPVLDLKLDPRLGLIFLFRIRDGFRYRVIIWRIFMDRSEV